MMLALGFAAPLLLIGLLAAAIPFALHLLSSVRAPQMVFPTLRFLHLSMEKTARRRKLEHWLLLLVRSLLLGALALAVAEPFTKGAGGFWADPRIAVAIVIDNSYSMGARAGKTTRHARSLAEARAVLEGDRKPILVGVSFTNGFVSGGSAELTAGGEMTSDLARARKAIASARLVSGRAPLAERIAVAADFSPQDRNSTNFAHFSQVGTRIFPTSRVDGQVPRPGRPGRSLPGGAAPRRLSCSRSARFRRGWSAH